MSGQKDIFAMTSTRKETSEERVRESDKRYFLGNLRFCRDHKIASLLFTSFILRRLNGKLKNNATEKRSLIEFFIFQDSIFVVKKQFILWSH